MARVRTVDFLPEIFQTSTNREFLSATLDQLVQEPKFKKIQGFVGRRVGPGVNPNDKYITEETNTRSNYQLEPGVVFLDPNQVTRIRDAITFPGITDALNLQGAETSNADRLYTSDYYSWDPFIDFDKFVNFSQYYWLPAGPDTVQVFSGTVPSTDNFVVTRANGSYTFSGVNGTNPTLTLVRGGSYTFQVAQNDKETVNYRVTNNATSAFVIDYEPNPTLTLVRGNTYVFNLVINGNYPFYIKTVPAIGTNNLYDQGVTNNGAREGLVTFTVPQDAPDTLYYANSTEPNMQGQLNIIDATPGTGPGFWIQLTPGVDGRLPYSPNISSRDVLGVVNNGEDLGTVTFNVPAINAQEFYYNLPWVGNQATPYSVELLTETLTFEDINNQSVEQFLLDNPTGIDGITSLNNRTLVIKNTQGWDRTTQFDPLQQSSSNNGLPGSYDSEPFDLTTPIDFATRYSVWQIRYITNPDGYQYIQLVSVQAIDNLQKFNISAGAQWASTQWYKNSSGVFEQVPLLTAASDVLYYQDGTDPEIFGRLKLIEPDQSNTLDVRDILGQKNYISPNGVTFTNGLKVQFIGSVVPEEYSNQTYYVEGVGTAIRLIPFADFVTPETYTKSTTVPYDSTPYDVGNYDASLNQPLIPDYLTINRASPDLNPWTRSNRWFHIDVINASAAYNNVIPNPDNNFRAKRPILEFRAGTKLFNFGTQGKQPVDIIDFATTDALSTINGSTGYNIDGYNFINGSRVIFAADTDPQVRNKIYTVEFIVPDSVPPLIAQPVINLVPAADSEVLLNQTVVCLSGATLQGKSFWYDGVEWLTSQQKTNVNQPPLFDIYDADGISFGNLVKYPSTNFRGSKLFSYAQGTGNNDAVLGFPVKYLSLTNVGDIVFDNNLYTDTFIYTKDSVSTTVEVSSGFVRQYENRVLFDREIGWQTAVTPTISRQQFKFVYDGQPLLLDVRVLENNVIPATQVYVNGKFQELDTYTVSTTDTSTTITLLNIFVPGDIIEVDVISDQVSKVAFYLVPSNLSNNPLNVNSQQFTLGTVRSHYESICENLISLSGPINGANNTRDLGNIVPYGTNIVQQSSPMTLAGFFMRSQEYNIFDALNYNSREYEKFKTQLLDTATRQDYTNYTIPAMLDAIVLSINSGRTKHTPFYWSDMLPSGSVFTQRKITITPITTNVFDLNTTYNFTSSNYQSVLIYLNDRLLTSGYDYEISPDGPRVTVTVPLATGDVITINEYSSTLGNFVPNTPTKLGLYPAFKPEIYLDTTYVNPTLVIQGHDGSKTVAFNDFRDELLLEFETRIYNNLKIKSEIPLTAADVIPGQFRTTDYTLSEINDILAPDFLTWVGWNKLNYKSQDFISDNEFTWNYSSAGNRLTGTYDEQPLLIGAWRGIYRYFYDTDYPNSRPWEMLGFTEEPTWWRDRYGPAPYTNGNLVLWDDLAQGRVADPAGEYFIPKYARPRLTEVIPAGSEGQLLSPLDSVVGQYDSSQWQKSWTFGDGGPVEAAWFKSSSYPFAIMRLLALTRPAEFFSLFADRDLYNYNSELGQYLYNNRYRLDANGIQVYGNGVSKASYVNWIVDYNQQTGQNSTTALETATANLDVRLCYRVGSFTDKQYLKIYTEKSSPNSLNSSLLLPDESYNLLLYKNQPFEEIVYSSVIVQTVQGGYTVYGYSIINPYFNILASRTAGLKTTISAGGTTVTVPIEHSDRVVQVPYGYVFTTQSMVVDFLLSYGALLERQGLTFSDQENGRTLNWNQMAQEFLYWSNQGWAPGSVINLNPTATTLTATRPQSIIDSVVAQTPENLLLDQNRTTLPIRDLVVDRFENTFKLSSLSQQTINYADLRYTNYESMVVLDNVSIFNDLIYDPATGARQSRINVTAAVSADWNGQLDAQGFILNNNANVQQWQPNRKYTKGEIVLYKNNYWSSQTIVQPSAEFDYSKWVKSDYTKIQGGLLSNIPLKANQLANSYNTNTANLEVDQDLLSYGLIGFRPRTYMSALNLDDVSQVNVYQQFLKDKGTIRAVRLLGNANLGKEVAEYDVFENWAIQRATYGANANRSFVEFRLNQAQLKSDPSTIQVVLPQQSSDADQPILLENIWRESYKLSNTNIFPTTTANPTDIGLPSAGYVDLDDVDITVFSLLGNLGFASGVLDTVGVGTTIWAAKSNSWDWNVYRCDGIPGRVVQIDSNLNNTSTVTFSGPHGLSANSVIIIRGFEQNFDGAYRVLSVPSPVEIVIELRFTGTVVGNGLAFFLQTQRVAQPSDALHLPYTASLIPGDKIWVDNNGQGLWEVLEKQAPFDALESIKLGSPTPNGLFGASVAQGQFNIIAMVGSPAAGSAGGVYTYIKNDQNEYVENSLLSIENTPGASGFGNQVVIGNQEWGAAGASTSSSNDGYAAVIYRGQSTNSFEIRQLLVAPDLAVGGKFGSSVAISQDERWLYIGAPVNNKVYVFGRVDVEPQSVTYITVDNQFFYQYNQNIEISNQDQLVVTLNNRVLTLNVDYAVNSTSIALLTPVLGGQKLTISRKNVVIYTGDGSTDTYNIANELYTANNLWSFTVVVNDTIYRPNIDYTYSAGNLIFTTPPADQDRIIVSSRSYFTYVDILEVPGITSSANFGASISTTTDGRQIIVGAPNDDGDLLNDCGSVYVFNRNTIKYIVTDPTQTVYNLPAGSQNPVNVVLNNRFLNNSAQYVNGEYTVDLMSGTVTISAELAVGDVVEIENNIFSQVQKVTAISEFQSAQFGYCVDMCADNDEFYAGSPFDGTKLLDSGSVDIWSDQARNYGTITSTVANASLTAGDTLGINYFSVAVPNSPNNTVEGFADAINAAEIPNVVASSVNGLLTISVVNVEAAQEGNLLTVYPGAVGSAYSDLGFENFVGSQTIVSPNPVVGAHFGTSIYMDVDYDSLIVGAPGGNIVEAVTFDNGTTYFDDRSTRYSTTVVQSGVVYTYDYFESVNPSVSNPGHFVFGQQVYDNDAKPLDQWGTSLSYVTGKLLVGAPGSDLNDSALSESNFGRVGQFENTDRLPAWVTVRQQRPVGDVNLINSVYMFDRLESARADYFDFINPLQGKILGAARRNIDYITPIDPAKYNVGNVNNNGNFWAENQVGEIWWDTTNSRFIDPNQDDINYASRRWGQLFPGSRVEVYQWVVSSVPPAEYTGEGTPYSTTNYTIVSRLTSQGTFETLYYFWVQGISSIDTGAGKTLSTTGVARYIESPRSSGIPYIAILDANTVAIYNGLQFLSAADTILHIEYDREFNNDNVHTEYELIAVDKADSFISANLYRKLQDSFCGVNTTGAPVPDPGLPPAERYGIQFRPRQSMFVDRFKALENYLGRVNNIIRQFPIVETGNFNLLNSSEPEPTAASGEWNQRLANIEELSYQDLYTVPLGYRYLIESDSTNGGLWTIYEVVPEGPIRKTVLVRVQTYDTRKYWSHIDWYLPGYNNSVPPSAEVPNYAGLATLNVQTGTSVKVTANSQNKWEIYLKTDTGWDRVGLEDGTIEFSATLWNYTLGKFGFDIEVFDSQYFDQEPVIETRKIIQAINEEILVGDLAIFRNQLLILIFEFILTEQSNPEWLVKTSLIDVQHRIRELVPFQVFRQDNQEFVLDYIQEVKPYHVQIREFNLVYNGEDAYPGSVTDFDLPAYYNTNLLIPQYVSPILLPYTQSQAVGTGTANNDSDTPANSELWDVTPYNEWFNNYGLSVQDVIVNSSGSGYTEVPTLTVVGNCTVQAELTAVINSAGRLVGAVVVEPGAGYVQTPVIEVTGSGSGAQLYPVMGNGLVREFTTVIRYDRYQYTSDISDWQPNVSYDNGTQVRYLDRVWSANSSDSTAVQSSTFELEQWLPVDADTLSGVDRTQGFYTPTANQPGLELPLLIDGIDYPGVQVMGPGFNQDTGFDVGNYDINPYDNISYGAEGRPTYDPGILDAVYESSYLDLYLGTRFTDINVDGGAYIDTYSSHAPEELVPGSEFDTLDLRVYTRPGSDWANNGHGFPENTVKSIMTSSSTTVDFSGFLPYPVTVIVSNQNTGITLNLTSDYSVDWINQTVTVDNGASIGDVLVVNVYGLGGGNQLYQNAYTGSDIVDNKLMIPVNIDTSNGGVELQELVIFVNGSLITNYTYAGVDRQVEIEFDSTYTASDYINITAMGPTSNPDGSTETAYSWSDPVTQYVISNGSLTINLDNSLEYTNPVNLVVTVNGVRARTAAGAEYIADGSTAYMLPTRLGFSQSVISDNEVFVYVNDVPLILGVDYFVEPPVDNQREVIFAVAPTIGDRILIAVTTRTQCYVNGNQLIFNPTQGLIPTVNDVVAITTWNDTRQQDILTRVIVGPVTTGFEISEGYDDTPYDSGTVSGDPGSFDYSEGTTISVNDIQLGRIITDPDKLWVYLNGRRLFYGNGWTLHNEELILSSGILMPNDVLMITEFTESTVPPAMAFRIFQDMRGVQATYRITDATTTTLAQPLSATDDIIYLADVSALSEPNLPANIWGVLTVNGERIMYRYRDTINNTVSSLLRGTAGTGAADHPTDSYVYDLGRGNLMPEEFQNYINSNSVLANGVQTTFTAVDIQGLTLSEAQETVEIFVGGTRIYQGYTITSADPVTVVFDLAPADGSEVTVLVRRGVNWYQPGAGTPSNGVALQDTNTQAARFLRGL